MSWTNKTDGKEYERMEGMRQKYERNNADFSITIEKS
jgi:hypothetical protein